MATDRETDLREREGAHVRSRERRRPPRSGGGRAFGPQTERGADGAVGGGEVPEGGVPCPQNRHDRVETLE